MYDYHVLVNLHKNHLINTLQKNKDRYVNSIDALKAAWRESSEQYRRDYQEWEAKHVAETLAKNEQKPQPPLEIHDRTEDYDLWLEMFNNTVGDYVEVNKEHFDMLWRDNWSWMGGHRQTIHRYACGDIGSFSVSTTALLASSFTAYNISV